MRIERRGAVSGFRTAHASGLTAGHREAGGCLRCHLAGVVMLSGELQVFMIHPTVRTHAISSVTTPAFLRSGLKNPPIAGFQEVLATV